MLFVTSLQSTTRTTEFFVVGELSVILTALLKVDFGSRSQSRVPDFYSTFVKKSTLKSTLLDFKSGKSDLDSTPPWRSDPYPKPYVLCYYAIIPWYGKMLSIEGHVKRHLLQVCNCMGSIIND